MHKGVAALTSSVSRFTPFKACRLNRDGVWIYFRPCGHVCRNALHFDNLDSKGGGILVGRGTEAVGDDNYRRS